MNVPALRGLPGIRIDVAPPPLAEVLPRMDVAVFVGFAATGPTHRPVVIESIAQYAAVFGPDAPLGWDGERGERVYANLGPAVRAFFSNGGRRCWVIRVARTQALEAIWRGSDSAVAPADLATTNRFPLPGVLLAPGNGALLAPAHAQARSTGSWSDSLHVATALGATGIALEGFAVLPPAGATQRITFNTRAPLQTGDLIQFDSPAAGVGSDTVQTYAAIDRVVTVTNGGRSLYRIDATICAAFEVLGGRAGSPSFFFAAGTAEVAGVTAGPRQATLQIDPAASLGASMHFTPAVPATLVEGQWARWTDGSQIVWLRIDAVSRRPSQLDATLTDTLVEGAAWRETTPQPLSSPISAPDRASLVTLDLRVFRDQAAAFRLAGVGLTPSHRASWWQQISDDVYYAPQNGQLSAPGGASGQVSRDFPLVALDDEFLDPTPRAFIPLGVKPLYGSAPGPLPEAASALERDGLARFDAELFLDPELATTEVGTLVAEADAIRFLRPAPRSLFGLHAALSVGASGLYNEASLIAVPDAVHIGWNQRPAAPPRPPAPPPATPPAHWFTHRGPCTSAPKDIAASEPDFSHFLDCSTRALAAPVLSGPTQSVRLGAFRLMWTPSEPGADYVLQEAQRADFSDARDIYRGTALEFDVNATREGVFYYCVSTAEGDERSAASNALAVIVRESEWLLTTPVVFALQGETELLRMHRALLRLAAASGELFAALALPQHYRAPETIRYAARLRAGRSGTETVEPDGFDFVERPALSYGALYHPWVVSNALPPPLPFPTDTKASDQESLPPASVLGVQTVSPPDGTMIGIMAARASNRGAWIAPANQPLKDVVALTPPIDVAAWLPLQDAHVNLIRAEPGGFLTLSADTLSEELERRPINVRRLLILLRRMALRRGVSYVFEPNGDILRRAVERGFTAVLNDMFRRGAFAGATAEESFKVVTDDAVNTAADRDAGRFLVELRVAPSLPLQFLTIRLAQSGERLTVAEEL